VKNPDCPFITENLPETYRMSKPLKLFLKIWIFSVSESQIVMDRGFYSEDNINGLYREHIKFLVGVKLSLSFIRKTMDDIYDQIRFSTNYDEALNTYGYTHTSEWDYRQERPYKGDVLKDKRRIYIHYYYSIDKGADDEVAFDKKSRHYTVNWSKINVLKVMKRLCKVFRS